MKEIKKSTVFFTAVISVIVGYIFNIFTRLCQEGKGNVIEKLENAIEIFPKELLSFDIGTDKISIIFLITGIVFVWLGFLYVQFDTRIFRRGEEYGSANWASSATIKPFQNNNSEKNIILTATESLNSERPKDVLYDRNKNVACVGGSGSGKTRFFVKPNLMQLNGSYVVTDPKGSLIHETGNMFSKNGYQIKTLNTINFNKSMHYNPLAYIQSEKDILKVVSVLIENTKGTGEKSTEDFWVKSERLLYSAYIGYLYYECPEDLNFPTLIDMIEASEVIEEDETFQNAIDILFSELEEKNPNNFAVKQYKKYKLAAGKTAKSILISCAARLAPFDIEEVRELMMYDELELDKLGDRKTILYLIMSDTDITFNFIIAMLLYQMFNLLCDKADDEYDGALPVPVSCYFDEFANVGKIPNFEVLIATIRSRSISASVILQSLSQLEKIYGKSAEIIIDCCDTLLFLGGKSTKTSEQISKMIGKQTISTVNTTENRGSTGSYSLQNSIIGRELLNAAEVTQIPKDECLLFITGVKPFKSKKYNIENHKRYKELSDFDKSLYYSYEKNKLKLSEFLADVKEIETFDISSTVL